MRTPKRHIAVDGTETWKVRFRLNGHDTSESFHDETLAGNFAQWLEILGPQGALNKLFEDQPVYQGPTVGELAEQFFTWKTGRVRSDRTVADYRRDYRTWIEPTFGDRDANSVNEKAVQEWIDAMGDGSLGRALSPKSIADRHAILFGIFRWASAPSRKLIGHNPCIGTDLPPRTKKQPKGLRPAEWQALYPALEQTNPAGADLALFLISTGWRFSEAAALGGFAVEDYDTSLYVSMGQVIRRNAMGQHVIVPDGKGDASIRRIKLDQAAADMVRRRMETVTGDGLVLTNARGNQWHYSNFLNRAWNPAVKLAELGRRPTPHWLRHTHVAWLVMGGAVSLPEIQRRIGHESISTTIGVYGRMIDDVSDAALERFAAFRSQQLPGGKPQLET
jgi:integrase